MSYFLKNIFKTISEIIGSWLNVIQIIFYFIGIGTTSTGGIFIIYDLPIIYPIALIVVGLCILASDIFHTVRKYRAWNRVVQNPTINDIMKIEYDYYICLAKIADIVVNRNKKKNIISETRNKIASEYYKMMGFSDEIIYKAISSNFKYNKREKSKFFKLLKLDPKNRHQIIEKFLSFGKMLNRAGLGLNEEMGNNPNCGDIAEKLHAKKLELEILEKDVGVVDDLRDFIYGAFSLAVALRLINRNRIWYKNVPLTIILASEDIKDDVQDKFDKLYYYTRHHLRKCVMKAGKL